MRALCRAVCLGLVAFVIGAPLLFSRTQELIIDNAKVRVLRVTVQPGKTTEIDHPELESSRRVAPAGKRKDADHDQNISWKQNEARWEPAGSSHSMKLQGNASVDAIVIELKSKGDAQKAAKSPQNPWLVDPKHYKIEFENDDVRVTRVKIGPKESTPLHEHSLNRIVIYLTPMDSQIDPEGKPSEHSAQKAGAVVWGAPARHAEHNLGDKAFEAVVIEPKF